MATNNEPSNAFEPLINLGSSGLKRSGGYVLDEWDRKLQGRIGAQEYRKMRDSDGTLGGVALAFESLVRSTRWLPMAANDSRKAQKARDLLKECMNDMSHSWSDLLGEIVTMLPYGWAYFEIVYKRRRGENATDPKYRSSFDDNKYGWRKIALRGQESLHRWEFQEDGGIAGMWQQAAPTYATTFIPIEKSLLFRTVSNKNNPEGRSFYRNAHRSFYFKQRLEEIEAIGLERNLAGLPDMQIPPEYLDANASPAHKALLANMQDMLGKIRADEQAYIIRPSEKLPNGNDSGWKFSLVSSGSRSTNNSDTAIVRHKQEMLVSVLMELLALGENGSGSNALSNDKTTMLGAVITSILGSIADVFNRFAVPRLMRLNGVRAADYPRIEHTQVGSKDLAVFAAALNSLVSAKLLTPDGELEEFVRDTMGLPEMAEGAIPASEQPEPDDAGSSGPNSTDAKPGEEAAKPAKASK